MKVNIPRCIHAYETYVCFSQKQTFVLVWTLSKQALQLEIIVKIMQNVPDVEGSAW